MVYFKYNTIVITCSCGCDSGIHILEMDGCVYISAFSGMFYTEQNKFSFYAIRRRAEDIIKYLKGKPVYGIDVCLKKSDAEDFLNAITSLIVEDTEEGKEKHDNYGYIRFEEEVMDDIEIRDEDRFFFLSIIKKRNKSVFNGHLYRMFDIVLTKKEWECFVKKCKKIKI